MTNKSTSSTDQQRGLLSSRRNFLGSCASGIGLMGLGPLALQAMLTREVNGIRTTTAPKAKRVIWLFMRGGVSHMESFDPKPALTKYAGKSISETPWADVQSPEKLSRVRVVVVNDANGQQRNVIFPLQTEFKQYGESGILVSNFFPHLGSCVDDLAIVRSMWTTDDNHGAQVQFHSGRHMLDGQFPTVGAWITYGLGSLNDNLPQFINMGPRFFDKRDGHYLGPAYDAVPLRIGSAEPLPFARPELPVTAEQQTQSLQLTNALNQLRLEDYPEDPVLKARIDSYELAFRMQRSIPDAIDFAQETEETHKLYGLDEETTKPFGMQLLAARRLSERGVRFIQIMHGDGAAGAWDAHSGLQENHTRLAKEVDRPIAGLLKDLKRTGMLEDTLVVFATEFGRTPGSQGGNGRDHHPFGFSIWMAGGGLKRGIIHGATDELGFHATESPHYVTDVHATLMKQLGIDARSLEVEGHKRLEMDYGHPIDDIIA